MKTLIKNAEIVTMTGERLAAITRNDSIKKRCFENV